MSYLTPTQATKVFRSRGNKVYGNFKLAVKKAKTISGRTAVMEIGNGKYIIKRV